MLDEFTQIIRDTRAELQPTYGAELTEEIIQACYRDSLKPLEAVEEEKKQISKALMKGFTKYIAKL